jgi:hypothetical protein
MSMANQVRLATSLREIEDISSELTGDLDACYRGEGNFAWDLIPTAYRYLSELPVNSQISAEVVAQVERDTYREFQSEAGSQLRNLDVLERLSIARHYGVPTRLLDWTSNLSAAVFFAVSTTQHADAAIWILNLSGFPFPSELGRQHRGGGFRLENIQKYGHGFSSSFLQDVSRHIESYNQGHTGDDATVPSSTFLVWRPIRNDDRLRRQQGLLSWYHSFKDDDMVWNYEKYIRDLEHQHAVKLLYKIGIPLDSRENILDELVNKKHINEYLLFGDLESLGRTLARKHLEELRWAVT